MNTLPGLNGLGQMQAHVRETVLSQDMDGEVVVLDLARGEYYGLNEVGSRIWTLLAQCKTLAQVLQSLTEEYEVTAAQVETDMLAFIAELQSRGLVELHAPTR